MCGLIGLIGEINVKDEKAFKQGLIIDTLRGEHSTGAVVVDVGKESRATIVKQVGNAFELLNDKRFDAAMMGRHKVLIGHNRYATQGEVNKANAHPFEFNGIYGAHNGTLSQRYMLEKSTDFKVDSQALYNHISLYGIEDAVSKIQGAWALTWWDSNEQTFNLLRNDERTLYTALANDNKTLYWCSEWEMLQLILNRNLVKYDKIKEVTPDTWMSIELDAGGGMDKPRLKKVAAKKPPVIIQNRYTGYSPNSQNATKTTTTTTATNTGNSVVALVDKQITRKGAVLEIGAKQFDNHMAPYYECLDADHPKAKIRLYLNRGDENIWKKDFIIKGDILSYLTAEGGYYKVSQSSVVLGSLEEQVKFDEKMGRFKELNQEGGTAVAVKVETKATTGKKVFLDHNGSLITKAQWITQYSHCAWCSADIDPNAENALTKGGDVLCPDCKTNPDVKTYL